MTIVYAARDIETVTLSEVVRSVRGHSRRILTTERFYVHSRYRENCVDMENAVDSTLSKETIKGLVASHG
jgi:hypothetical protein